MLHQHKCAVAITDKLYLLYLGTGVSSESGNFLKFHAALLSLAAALWADWTVFFMSIATVIGPTPPGTGVMYDATFFASSKATSPTNFWPDFLVLSIKMYSSWLNLQNVN